MNEAEDVLLAEELETRRLSLSLVRRLWVFVRPYRRLVVLVMAAELAWVLALLVGPHLVKVAIDEAIPTSDLGLLALLCVVYAASVARRAGLDLMQLRCGWRAGQGALGDLRVAVFSHIQKLSMAYFDRTKEGRIIARVDRDIDALEAVVTWGPVEFTSCLITLALSVVQMSLYDASLCLAVSLVLVPLAIATEIFRRKGLAAYRRVRSSYGALSGVLAESISGVRVTRAFARGDDERRAFRERVALHDRNVLRAALTWNTYMPVIGSMYVAATAIIVVYGGQRVADGHMQIGEVAAFILLLGWFFGPVEWLGELYNLSLAAGSASERIFALLDTQPEIADLPGAVALKRGPGEIRFERVGFRYAGGEPGGWSLEEIDFVVEPGKVLALVGETGAGKSSIVSLLARFHEPTSGRVLVDGFELRDLTLASLRSAIGIVLQDGFLFGGTVLDNLRFANPGVTEEEAVQAAREIGADRILSRLARGYRTEVGERGGNLSHGERQLVTLTRALLADPMILVLDEATSAVDALTEHVIRRAIRRVSRRRTTVVVAHRLSTVTGADIILVLDRGRIVERGRHRELLAAGGVYARLHADFTR